MARNSARRGRRGEESGRRQIGAGGADHPRRESLKQIGLLGQISSRARRQKQGPEYRALNGSVMALRVAMTAGMRLLPRAGYKIDNSSGKKVRKKSAFPFPSLYSS